MLKGMGTADELLCVYSTVSFVSVYRGTKGRDRSTERQISLSVHRVQRTKTLHAFVLGAVFQRPRRAEAQVGVVLC